MPTMYLLCGIPVSGKATVAKEIAATEKAVLLSFQDIREELFGPNPELVKGSGREKEIYRMLNTMFRAALAAGRDTVIDSANPTPAVRRRYAKAAKKLGYRTVCVYCHKHFAYAMTASMMRDGCRHPANAIRHSVNTFVPPEPHEGWDEIRIMDGNRYSLEIEGQIPVERRSTGR